jgi:hypothetical protein
VIIKYVLLLFVVILGVNGTAKAEAEAMQPLVLQGSEKPCACKAAALQIPTFP